MWAALPACSEARDNECDSVVDAINAHIDAVAMPHTSEPDKDMAAYAGRLADYEVLLDKIAITDPGLAERFGEYAGMVRALREASEDFSRRGSRIDQESARELETRFNALAKRESRIVFGINEYCGRS